MGLMSRANGKDAASPQEDTDADRAILESLADESSQPVVEPSASPKLSPANALFRRKPSKPSKKSGKRAKDTAKVEAVKQDQLDLISTSPEQPNGADDVLDLADQLLDQLDVEETATPVASTSSSVSSVTSADSQTTEPSSPRTSLASKLAHPFRSNRQQQRKERRAQEWQQQSDAAREEVEASGQDDAATKEKEAMQRQCEPLGLVVVDIPPDGHCMFSAVADQLNILGHSDPDKPIDHNATRKAAAEYMRDHPDDFMPFLQPEEIGGQGDMTFDKFAEYCDQIEQTSLWGGQTEINALSHAYSVPIHVFTGDAPVLKVGDGESDRPVRLAFYRSLYGLGEHYNSIHSK